VKFGLFTLAGSSGRLVEILHGIAEYGDPEPTGAFQIAGKNPDVVSVKPMAASYAELFTKPLGRIKGKS
jgi:hypothetical protein